MRDVALAAGVSPMTVSQALRKDSPILKDVRDMNDVPDQWPVASRPSDPPLWPIWCRP